MVAIKVQAEEDAYRIFETLNDRGLRLSVPDLLLNLLMRRSADDTQRNLVRQKWNYMLGQMDRRDISRFLRHMWFTLLVINAWVLKITKAGCEEPAFRLLCSELSELTTSASRPG